MRKLSLGPMICCILANAIAWTGAAYSGDDAIKIGVMADMNGPLASASGQGSFEAARIAAEEFGWSIKGKRIEIISADHQNKPDLGAAIARRWFDIEHVDVVADLSNSAVGFAVVEIARPLNKIILVSGPGSSDFTGKACAPTSIHWTWDTYAAATSAVKAVFGPGADTWFFIASDFAFGHALERDGARAVEKLGGKVVGRVRPPFNSSDFSSFLLQAQQSKASVIAFATGGQDTVNLVKQAAEFGLAKPGTRVIPMQMMIDEMKAIGPQLGQGSFVTMAFHHDISPEARAWSQRFFQRMKAMPTQIQAGTYSAVRHYLQAVKDGDNDEPLAVVAKMRQTPVNDIFAMGGRIRQDGRMVHDMYLVQIKTPAESTDPWDLVKIIKTIPGDEAFRPLSESECPLVQKAG
ncbi:ABC transporter substrate-binding protein [Bradyrhizobium sp. AUGA SZCCT0431]|uniref:ABC transporter substrate-binding protein n=1 Tax=Bradyrhizobium sp. AUGA SZCCT0431 TaxID=2807674 RepID=UPI001BA99C63|nr:ABC transporter substrate-binding protein [Bradyrhizobium sp. AUGA SZCCT0431]MBR1144396.1 ABC transporter substrate-binding protein [Bradyrhizobium sp. AUGA SZCCT0431]